MDEPHDVSTIDVAAVQARLRQFATDRDWDQFHTPKNLVMALMGEVGELAELFQWVTADESERIDEQSRRVEVEDELADILQYLIRIADRLGIDLGAALLRKLDENELRYRPEQVQGRALKMPRDR